MPFFIDPELNQLAQSLRENRYQDHEIDTDENLIEDEDFREEIENAIIQEIQRLENIAETRRIENTPERKHAWDENSPKLVSNLSQISVISLARLAVPLSFKKLSIAPC